MLIRRILSSTGESPLRWTSIFRANCPTAISWKSLHWNVVVICAQWKWNCSHLIFCLQIAWSALPTSKTHAWLGPAVLPDSFSSTWFTKVTVTVSWAKWLLYGVLYKVHTSIGMCVCVCVSARAHSPSKLCNTLALLIRRTEEVWRLHLESMYMCGCKRK